MSKFFAFFVYFGGFFVLNSCARLNTPRVLLPPNFGAAKNNFTLVVSEGGCYQWSSSRTDLVTVTAIDSQCSTKAVVSAVSGANPPQIAIITAEDNEHHQILRCDVVVDVVSSLEVVTTSRQLFLGDAPTLIEVTAKNEQGDTFSTLHGIEFEWTLVTTGDEENTLRFLKFSDSTYQPPVYINALEDQGLQGDKILIEGFKVGSSKVRVRLRDPAYMNVKPTEVTLTVVANIVISPAHDVYLLKHSQFHYRVDLIKDGRAYEVTMPSDEYYLEVENSSIAKLDRETSNITATEYGHTNILLKDKNAKAAEIKQQLSAGIHVVQPSYMLLHVTPGENWALQELTYYEITIKIYDDRHHRIIPSDNLRLDTKFHTKYFKIFHQSANGTYFVVKTLLPGPTKIQAEIKGIETEDGKIHRLESPVKVAQEVIIYQALQVEPSVILMPWDGVKQSSFSLKLNARGATGFYVWASENPLLATISFRADEESKLAMVKTLGQGEVKIHIRDAHNSVFYSSAMISIQAVADLEILPTVVEAEIGNDVVIPLALYGFEDVEKKKRKIFNSCSDVPIVVEVVDKTKIEYNPDAQFPAMGAGCRSLAFNCKSVGYSRIYVQYDVGDVHLKTTAVVACHKPLKAVYPSRMMLLPIGSIAEVAFEGGPRPWPMHQEGHILKLDEKSTSISSNNVIKDPHRFNRDLHIFRVLCKELGETTIEILVGNEKSPTNLNPALLSAEMLLVCGVPDTLFLRPLVNGPDGKKLPCPIGEEPTRVPVQNYKDLDIDVWAKDSKGRKFGNLTSFDIRWELSDYTLAKLDSPRDIISQANGAHGYKKVYRSYRTLNPDGKEGQIKVTAKIIGYRSDVLTKSGLSNPGALDEPISRTVVLDLVDDAEINPSKVTIFNHQTNKAYLNITKGSGFFSLEVSDDTKAQVEYFESMRHIRVIPIEDGSFTITVHDLCLHVRQLAVVDVQISGVETVVVKMVDKVQLNKTVIAKVQVLGSDMLPLSPSLYPLLNLHPVSTSSILSTKLLSIPNSEDLHAHYLITGTALGQTSLTFKIEPSDNLTGAENKGYRGRQVSSDPVQVQVFSALRLSPRNITLVVGATFQVVCSGGPEAYSNIEYVIQDEKVVSISTAGILTASKLGHTVLTARIIDIEKSTGNQVLYSLDTATVFVVPLHGIKIHSPLRRLQTGTKMPIYAMGLNDQEIPFAFGTAVPKLSLRWGLNNTEVVKLENMFKQSDTHQNYGNNFATRVTALKPGQVTVTLEAYWSIAANDKEQMQMSKMMFKDEVPIQVFGDLQLTKPDINEGTIIMMPNTQLQLKSSRDSFARVSYKVGVEKTKDPIVRLESKSLLISGAQTGEATLTLSAIDDYGMTQRKTVDIRVRNVAYLMVTANTVARTKDHALSVLPFSWTSVFTVSAHDNIGQEFNAANVQLKFRPSRFDIIHVNEGIDNRTLTVRACQQGQTVLKVWDSTNPNLADYVPVWVESAIEPTHANLLEGDIVCFTSALVTHEGQSGLWNSDSNSIIIHPNSGIAVAVEPGSAFVDYSISEMQITKSKMNVLPIASIEIQATSSTIVSNWAIQNIPILLKGDHRDVALNLLGKNCSYAENLRPQIQPPIICKAVFTDILPGSLTIDEVFDISTYFDLKTGYYSCRLTPLQRAPADKIALLRNNIQLSVEHKNGLFKSLKMLNFVPAFHIDSKKLLLKEARSTVSLIISANNKMAECIVVLSSDSAAFEILSQINSDSIRIPIRLRHCPKSSEHLITVKCPLTGQEEKVAVETCVGDNVPDTYNWMEQIKTIAILVGTLIAMYIGYRVSTTPKVIDIGGSLGPNIPGFSPITPSTSPSSTRLWTVDNGFPNNRTPPSLHRTYSQSPNTHSSFSYADYLQPR